MIEYSEFFENLKQVQSRIAAACATANRDCASVQLLPVTKNHPLAAIQFAHRAGLFSVGENRVQEASGKHSDSAVPSVRWELIGHLQSNKAKEAVGIFDRIQSVDSIKLIHRLDRQAGDLGKCLPVLLQCNTGEDPNKYGFRVEEMEAALEAVLKSEHLQVDGLMTIAPLDDDLDVAKRAFQRLRELRDNLANGHGVELRELSMGMTGDLEAAIAAGSTQIRVGTALFGGRNYN
ncbi:MAG: YggS family pyridoxal phosphate-dependent enzyme [Opitutaceae bacterium]